MYPKAIPFVQHLCPYSEVERGKGWGENVSDIPRWIMNQFLSLNELMVVKNTISEIFCLTLLLVLPAFGLCQDETSSRPLRVGVGLAGYQYQGDLTDGDENPWRMYPGMGLTLQFESSQRLSLRLGGGFGKIIEQTDRVSTITAPEGIEPNQFVATSFFYTDIRLTGWLIRKGPVRPYVGTGAGLLFFTPLDQEGNFLSDNLFSRLPDESYGTFAPQLPLMAGINIKPHPRLTLGLEYTYKLLGTDYLDNLGELGAQAGNDRLQDLVLSVQISLPNGASQPKPAPTPEPQPEYPVITGDFTHEYWTGQFPEMKELVRQDVTARTDNVSYRPAQARHASSMTTLEQPGTWEELANHFEVPYYILRSLNPQVLDLEAGTVLSLP